MENLKKYIENKKIDYNDVKDKNIVIIQNPEETYDINFLITVRGRKNFAEPMYRSFLAAKERSNLNITYTVIEHSHIPEHSKFCKDNKINYIWIKSKEEELFNKCLAYNMGVFFGNKSKFIIFHDIDCLVQSDFFLRLAINVERKKCRAIQCFTGRRVLYLNTELTSEIISNKEFDLDSLNIKMPEVRPPAIFGAPGGSIMVERDLYFEAGGYDAELFLANSPEDAFFWEKIDTIDKMYISDDPDIELYHMHHPPTWMNNPFIGKMKEINSEFKNFSNNEKKEIIKFKSDVIKDFK